ncbi:MAG: alpha-L-rhamnosidase C-terminal domain-containing protein [Prolixibacteraceae bacterium]
MMGSVDSWFYKYILGIRPDINYPAFQKFTIRPVIFSELDHAEGELVTVKGVIKSSWKKSNGVLFLNVTIPANTTARIYIPAKNAGTITEGGKKISEIKELAVLSGEEDGCVVLQAGSGDYHFKTKILK